MATFSNAAVTFFLVQRVALRLADGERAEARLQSGESGSVTVTSLSVTLPVFVTVILKCRGAALGDRLRLFGSLMIVIAGFGVGAGVGGFGVGGGVTAS